MLCSRCQKELDDEILVFEVIGIRGTYCEDCAIVKGWLLDTDVVAKMNF
jgi:hypothetical protein